MRGRYQGGSLAGFIIIGAVLALVLVGGLYGLNRYNAEQSKEVATDQSDGSNEKSPSEGSSEQKAESGDSSNQSEPATTEENGSESQPGTDANQSADSSAQDDSAGSELPATGPTDMIMAFVAVALLGFLGAHYVQSRLHKSR